MIRLEQLASRLEGQHTLILGDVWTEEAIWGDRLRLCEDAPVPAMNRVRRVFEPAGAAPIASLAQKLGAMAMLSGPVGFDDAASALRELMIEQGVAVSGLFPSEIRSTNLVTRLMSLQHQRLLFRIDDATAGPLRAKEVASLNVYLDAVYADIDSIALCDFEKGTFATEGFARKILRTSRSKGLRSVVLAQTTRLDQFAGAVAIVCSIETLREFLYINGRGYLNDLTQAGDALSEMLRCEWVIVYEPTRLRALGPGVHDSRLVPGASSAARLRATWMGPAITAAVATGFAAGLDVPDALETTLEIISGQKFILQDGTVTPPDDLARQPLPGPGGSPR